jgi:hypothetical protein
MPWSIFSLVREKFFFNRDATDGIMVPVRDELKKVFEDDAAAAAEDADFLDAFTVPPLLLLLFVPPLVSLFNLL